MRLPPAAHRILEGVAAELGQSVASYVRCALASAIPELIEHLDELPGRSASAYALELMEAEGLSQRDAAKAAGISESMLSRVRSGGRHADLTRS